jgi:hypothetical protein
MGKLLSRGGSWLVLLLVVGISTSEGRAAAPPRPAWDLDGILREWARASDGIHSVRYRFTQTEDDRIFNTRKVRKGEVQLLKPDLLRVDLDIPHRRTILLFTKDKIHFFNPDRKTESIFPKPADRSFLGESTPARSLMDFFRLILSGVAFQEGFQQWVYWVFAGLPVRDLTQRFNVRVTKQDAWYVYLEMQRGPLDSSFINSLNVVLQKDSHRVRQLWYEHRNGNRTTIDIEKPDTSAKVTSESIRKGLPQGWKRFDPFEDRQIIERGAVLPPK